MRGLGLFVLAACAATACGGPHGSRAPRATARAERPGARDASADERRIVEGAARDARLHDRLARALAPLARPPFGTAAAVTAIVGSRAASASIGTLGEGGPPASDDTRFDVASVSKAVTAARVVSLAHAGALGLDDPVAKHLPGVKLLDADGVDRAGAITIRDLLRHTSGLPHVPPDLDAKVANRWPSPELLRLLTGAWEIRLAGPPGRFRYSNTGYALLGAIVERTGRCSFADCMAGYLAELGMRQSTFWPDHLERAAPGRVVVDGAVTFNPPFWYASRYALPFSGLWTSTPDLARFGATLLAASRDPASALHAMTPEHGAPLGLFRGERLGAPSFEHDGSGPGFYAALVVVPSRDLVVAVATNGGNEKKEEGRAFADAVAATIDALADR